MFVKCSALASTTVEIIRKPIINRIEHLRLDIYNSRNYKETNYLATQAVAIAESTTVEIIRKPIIRLDFAFAFFIYNSRNYKETNYRYLGVC